MASAGKRSGDGDGDGGGGDSDGGDGCGGGEEPWDEVIGRRDMVVVVMVVMTMVVIVMVMVVVVMVVVVVKGYGGGDVSDREVYFRYFQFIFAEHRTVMVVMVVMVVVMDGWMDFELGGWSWMMVVLLHFLL
ncbi:hypothetical protein E2C01_084824 [Portunus trituberculatus]|uniref:Uncharacterized protein n=1 Tax=Portunus trituberculatus TaxID=210409 RepID=A0A5B7J0Z9_PORTR|nr:hypothetical protein [Portunus trituberculatus]